MFSRGGSSQLGLVTDPTECRLSRGASTTRSGCAGLRGPQGVNQEPSLPSKYFPWDQGQESRILEWASDHDENNKKSTTWMFTKLVPKHYIPFGKDVSLNAQLNYDT